MNRRAVLGGVVASAALISVLTVLARLTGFGRQLVFSSSIGAACVGEAYATANLVPNVLFELAAGGALAAAVVPLLAPLTGEAARRTAAALLTWAVLILAPLSLVVALLAGPLTRLLLPGQDCAGQRSLAASMLIVFAPQVLLYGVGAVLAGALQATDRFAWPAVAPLLSSVVVIVAYLGYAAAVDGRGAAVAASGLPEEAFAALAWGTTAGVVALTLPLLIPLWRSGFRLRPTLSFPPGSAAAVRALAVAGVVTVAGQQVFLIVLAVLANHRGPTGTLNVYGYAQAVWLLPHAVLAVPVVTALFPRLSRAGEGESFRRLSAVSLRLVLLAGAAGAALLAGTAPAVAALFTALDSGRIGPMATALTVWSPGLIGFAVMLYAGRALFALQATRHAALGNAAAWLAATVAAAGITYAVDPGQVLPALAAGNSVGMLTGGAILLAVLARRAGSAALQGFWPTTLVALLAAAVAATAGRWVAGGLLVDGAANGSVLGAVAAGLVAAAVVAVIFALPVALLALLTPLLHAGLPAAEDGRAGTVLMVLGSSSGGIGRHVMFLAGGVRAEGMAVRLAGPQATLDAIGSGGDRTPLPITERPHPVRDLQTLWRLRGLVQDAAVVHAHGVRAGAFSVLAARGLGVPVAVTLHNAAPTGGLSGAIFAVLQRIVARGAAAVLVVSDDLGEQTRRLGAASVHRALVPSPSWPADVAPTEVSEVRAALGVPPGTALLVTVARLAVQKGLPVLLDAVAELTDRADRADRPVRCVVAGDGPLRAELTAETTRRRLPVDLLGTRRDVPDLLAAADVVVVPSLWEGQPLIVQEALRAGAAIVATDSGGTAQVAGDGAVLVPPGDAPALARAVRALLADPDAAAALRGRARRRADDLPTDTQALAQAVGLYQRLAADRLESRGAAHA